MPRLTILAQIVFFILLLFVLSIRFALAQSADNGTGIGVAQIIQTAQKDVQDGVILAPGPKGAILSKTAYDPQAIGVVSRNAAITLDTIGEEGVPVISTGTVYMQVSTINGPIKKGDLLATSTIPGVGAKATQSGYVMGSALEDDSNPDPKKIDIIAVDLNLHYYNSKPTFVGTLTDILKIALLPTQNGPAPIFKYIVAATVVLGSFVLGFISFARTAAKGVEALGRNPSASATIHLGIIFNVGIVIAIILAGLTVAFFILRL